MKRVQREFTITSVVILLVTNLLIIGFSYLYHDTTGEIIRNGIFSVFFTLGFFYFYHYLFKLDKLDYDNSEHPLRLLVSYMIGIVFVVLFPLVDRKVWIFLSIGVAIALFTNAVTGLYTVAGFILFTLLLSGQNDIVTFFVYFISAAIGILLFQNIDKSFKVSHSIIISVLTLIVLEVAGFILLANEALEAEEFIMPLANVCINILTLFFVLKYFNLKVANKYRNRYLEINDQEYKALTALKEISKEEYFRSIHTAYLVERMANAIGCDVDVSKNCAYYHRIKSAFSFDDEGFNGFIDDNEFPPAARELLLKYVNKNDYLSKEAGLVYISDRVIYTFMEIFAKDKNIRIDYSEFVSMLFDKIQASENLKDSDLSRKDFNLIKDILLKETLYYDFLR